VGDAGGEQGRQDRRSRAGHRAPERPSAWHGEEASTTAYCIVVQGELGPSYRTAFEGMTLLARGGRTEIVGEVVDQAGLQGTLDRIGELGLTLVSVNPASGAAGFSR
jgi:hypothetical protein